MEIQTGADAGTILIVEDDKEIRQGIEIFLKGQGYRVCQAADGIEGLKIIEEQDISLAIVDVMMPRMDGITMVIKLREKYDFPVIFLSAKSEEVDKIMGLNMGADDYVTKPFSLAVLRARVNNLLRRGAVPRGEVVELPPFSFDFAGMAFSRNGEAIELSKTEQRLLRLLVEHRGQTLTREQLLDRVWDGGEFVDENALSVAVRRLRAKLGDAPIKTVYGLGYTWEIQ